jgi:hypothetical protein
MERLYMQDIWKEATEETRVINCVNNYFINVTFQAH